MMNKLNFSFARYDRQKIPKNLLKIQRQYLIVFVIVITASSLSYFYSIGMALLTTLLLAYLSKGSRCK